MLVGAELVTGTFYLLAVGVAFAVGGVAAILGVSLPMQLVVAGVARGRRRPWSRTSGAAHACRRRTPSLDLGQTVRVLGWNDDGTARVNYRGTQWNAELAAAGASRAETMYIVGTRGSTLLIADRRA